LFGLIAFAQSDAGLEEALLDQQSLVAENQVFLQQVGYHQQAAIRQRDAYQAAWIVQQGRANRAQIRTRGSVNQVLVRQRGQGNAYELDLDGVDNRFVLRQDGRANEVRQSCTDVRHLRLGLIQQGVGNRIVQQQSGSDGKGIPVIIKQQGNGMQLLIRAVN
jgi:hypothetical protein